FVFSSLPQSSTAPGAPSPRVAAYIISAFGGVFAFGGAILTTLNFLTARALSRQCWRTLCLFTAAVSCIFIPYGTLLGVWTFMVLGRPSVRPLFERSSG